MSQKQPSITKGDQKLKQLEEEDDEDIQAITNRLVLVKPGQAYKLDKDIVLRRIRHRKRVNKLKNAAHARFTSPFSTIASSNSSKQEMASHFDRFDHEILFVWMVAGNSSCCGSSSPILASTASDSPCLVFILFAFVFMTSLKCGGRSEELFPCLISNK
ncbi:hypothetical protein Ancab_008433 [Ancistrocladus abbreviatus]